MKRDSKFLNTAVSVIWFFSVFLFVMLSTGGRDISDSEAGLMLTASAVFILIFLIGTMAGGLRASLGKTLYSYKNAMLIGGIIFTSIMAVSLTASCIDCLNRSGSVTASELFDIIIGYPKSFTVLAVPVISLICLLLAISNISLIRHEGFHLHNLMSVLLAVFYLGGTLALTIVSAIIYKNVIIPSGLDREELFIGLNTFASLFLRLCLSYFECIFAGFIIMGKLTASHVPAYDKDFVIILGCSIDKRGGLLPLLKGRTNRAYRFGWEQEIAVGKPVIYIPSGGQGSNEVISEGSAMELYLLSHGVEDSEVIPEKQSKNTFENMLFSKKIADGIKPNARFAFATTNYHIYRSGILARKAGLDAEGIASGTKWYFWPNGFIREFFAVLAMHKSVHIITAAVIAFVCVLLAVMKTTLF